MRSRRKWFFLFLSGIVAGIVAWKLTREPEPVYKDRPLSEWVLLGYYPVGIKELAGRREAIRQVGTNAIPHLVKWISHETPQWRTDLADYLSGLPWPLSAQTMVNLIMDRRSEALSFKSAYCFRDLGTNAHIAFPQLQAIATTPNGGRSSGFAITALEASGSSAIPNLLAVIGEPNSPFQRTAINSVFGLISTNRDQKSRWSPITERLNDPDPVIRRGVTNFSRLIRPELLTNGIPR